MPDLFDFSGPVAHDADPMTSHEAATNHTTSGNRKRCCVVVLGLVQRHPGLTCCELWEAATEAEQTTLREMQRVRQRMVDLERNGLVRKGPPRKCAVRGTSQRTWNATN